MITPALMLLSLLAPVHAVDWIEDFTYTEYRAGPVGGTDGWVNGYSSDPWVGMDYDGTSFVFSATDDYSGSYWGDGQSLDNYLVNTEATVDDGAVSAIFFASDDDTLGYVLHFQDASNYYIFMLCGAEVSDGPSSPFGATVFAGIVKISEGSAELLASEEYAGYAANELDEYNYGFFAIDDGVLTAEIYTHATDSSGDPAVRLTVEDPDPFPEGPGGFYAYNMGGNNDSVYFGPYTQYGADDDEDGVMDDDDNCEQDANTDQADEDGDGVGNACDPDYEPGGDDTEDPGGDDTEDPGGDDTEDPGGDDTDPGVVDTNDGPQDSDATDGPKSAMVPGGGRCGCSTSTPDAGAWGLLLLGLGLLRRRFAR